MNQTERLLLKPHRVHKYERVDISRDKAKPYWVYKCRLPNCPHYIVESLVWGRATICWRCDDEFIIDSPKLRGVKHPYCNDCKYKHHLAKPKPISDPALEDLLASLKVRP